MLAELPALGVDLDEAVRSILTGGQVDRTDRRRHARVLAQRRAREWRPPDLNRAINATLEVVRHEYRQVADIDLVLGECRRSIATSERSSKCSRT